MMRRVFKTGRGCANYQLYFESGQLPARYVIKRMKVVFFHYILTQKEETLMFKFLMAQRNYPTKGDWYSDVSSILKEFEININIEDIKKVPAIRFKRIVKQKSEIAGFNYLKEQQQKCEKGSRIKYESLELQDYLNPSSNILIENQRFLFSLRCEMNILKSNFKRNTNMIARYCIKSCKKEIVNEHLIYCSELNGDSEVKYEHILNGSIQEKVEALKQVQLNEQKRTKENIPL